MNSTGMGVYASTDSATWHRMVLATCLFALAFALWLLVHPATHYTVKAVDDVATVLGPMALLPWAFGVPTVIRSGMNRAFLMQHRAALVISVGILCSVIGDAIFGGYDIARVPVPYPSMADVFYLAFYPLTLVGVLMMRLRGLSGVRPWHLTVNGLLLISAIATIAWYFTIGPTVYANSDSLLGTLVAASYPLGDVVLVTAILFIWLEVDLQDAPVGLTLLVVGLVIIVVGDSVYTYQSLHNLFSTGTLLDVTWPVGNMLLATGAYVLQGNARGRVQNPDMTHLGESPAIQPIWIFLPYGLLLLMLGVVIRAYTTSEGPTVGVALDTGVYIGFISFVILLAAHQGLFAADIRSVYDRLQRAFVDLEEAKAQLERANVRLYSLATLDALTEIPNHRTLSALLDAELERSHRYGRPLSILFLDIDHFKNFNDVCGHLEGNAALREFTGVVRGALRKTDTLGRWGGEEFLAILPETDLITSRTVAERVRVAVEEHQFEVAGGRRLTCSIGAATVQGAAVPAEQIVQQADVALYRAKNGGRNRVETESVAVSPRADDPLLRHGFRLGD